MIYEGINLVLFGLIVTFCCLITENNNLSCVFLILTLFILYFFRDPDRKINYIQDYCYSPCDGEVIGIEPILIENKNYICISIFLNVLDIHKNWLPIKGTVNNITIKEGRFDNALTEKTNAKVTTHLKTDFGDIYIDQITGLFARRIKNYLNIGYTYETGDPMGFIILGSKMKVFVPDTSLIIVNIGQRCVGGQTLISKFN